MNVKIDKHHIFLQTPVSDKSFVTNELNGVWSAKHKAYRFPKNLNAMRELMVVYPDLKSDSRFVSEGLKLRSMRENYLLGRKSLSLAIDHRLRPYQNTDVFTLSDLDHAGIFNEQRTGKTPTAITLMKRLGTKRNLVIAPASLIWNWAAEFEQWYPECHVFVASGTRLKRCELYRNFNNQRGTSVLVISKDTWKNDHKLNEDGQVRLGKFQFDTCFVDEAHYLRNYKSSQSKAVFEAAKMSKRRYALTGTPTVKHAADIFGILKFLQPEAYTSYWQFVDRYFNTGFDEFGRLQIGEVKKNRQVELQELIGFMSVQRKRAEVMQWLPKKQYIPIRTKMNSKQAKLYKHMKEEFIAYLESWDEDVTVDTPNVLSQLTRLRQLCLDPRLLGFETTGAKTEALLEWLEDNKEPVVIMSMFTSYLKLLKPEIEKFGLKVGMIHGEMQNSDKHNAASEFQAGRYDVLLCNVISAGTGFTLDRASVIAFTDKAWNPAENAQAEDRITPVMEERLHEHTVISFLVDDSVDYRMEGILKNKQSLTDIINNGGRLAILNLLK